MKTKPCSPAVNFETHTPRIIASGLLAILLLLVLMGCKNATCAADINPVGVYTLVSVDGKSVLCDLSHEGTTMTVKSGVFTINADGTCRSQITFAVQSRPEMSREVNATYTQKGAELTMRWEGAGMTKGNIAGDKFTMNNEGMIFSYRK